MSATKSCRERNQFRVFLRVYADCGHRYSNEFKKTIENILHSQPFFMVDYKKMNTDKMASTTHLWLARSTGGQVTQLESISWRPIDSTRSSLCLVSGASLDCAWTTPFQQRHTRHGKPFFVDLAKKMTVEMMRQKNTLGLYTDEQMQVLRLEYADSDMAMYVLLPRLVNGLDRLEKNMTPEFVLAACDAAKQRLQLVDVSPFSSHISLFQSLIFQIHLPKCKIECEISDSLIVGLDKSGLAASFKKGAANFSRMLDANIKERNALWISGIAHKVRQFPLCLLSFNS